MNKNVIKFRLKNENVDDDLILRLDKNGIATLYVDNLTVYGKKYGCKNPKFLIVKSNNEIIFSHEIKCND